MIISTISQEKIIDKWNTKDKTTRDLICFMEGMEAVFALIEKKTKDSKDFYKK